MLFSAQSLLTSSNKGLTTIVDCNILTISDTFVSFTELVSIKGLLVHKPHGFTTTGAWGCCTVGIASVCSNAATDAPFYSD